MLFTDVLQQCIDPIFKGPAVQEDYPEQVEAWSCRGWCGQWLVLRDRKRTNQLGAWGKTEEKCGHQCSTRKIGI